MSAPAPTTLEVDAVDPGRAVGWWADAALMLWRHAFRWLALGLLLMLVLGAAAALPVVGVIVSTGLAPLFVGGWMRLAQAAQAGEAPSLRIFVQAWRPPQRRALLWLGAAAAAGALLVLAASHALGLAAMLGAVHVDGPTSALAREQMASGMLWLLLLLVFSLLVSAALWFAPALVVLRGVGAAAALTASLRAVRDNGLAFLLFGVIQTLIAAVASLPYHVGWVLLVPTMLTTVYTSYRDVFGAAGRVTPP